MSVKILIWVVILVNAKQLNAGRHIPIAVKNINILRKKDHLENSSEHKVY